MEDEVNISELIHRGGIFRNVEGSNPKEVYAKVSKMIEILIQMMKNLMNYFLQNQKKAYQEHNKHMVSHYSL